MRHRRQFLAEALLASRDHGVVSGSFRSHALSQTPGGDADKFSITTDLAVWREVDGEVIVLEMDSGNYLNLNGSARILWMALSETASEAELVGSLMGAYGVDEDQADHRCPSLFGRSDWAVARNESFVN